jgi:hypothetical protein
VGPSVDVVDNVGIHRRVKSVEVFSEVSKPEGVLEEDAEDGLGKANIRSQGTVEN